MKKFILITLIILILLVLPLVFKSRSQPGLQGPDLSEFQYTEVTFDNTTENFKLAGMLILPEGKGPFPVAVLIHGSGSSLRNSVWYLSVAKHLRDNGIAVLLPDKRGCEKSEGEWIGVDLEQLANDVTSAVEYIKNQHNFSYSMLGVVGMSQGGWIAPVAATKSNDINFVAVMSGSSVTMDEQLLHEEINNIAPYTYRFIAKLLAPVATKMIKKMEHIKPLVGFDPIPYWKRIEIPVFFGFGGDDKNVPVEACIERLKENKLNRFQIKTYPQGGHAIRNVESNRVSKEYLDDLVIFIKEVNL